MKKNLLCKLGLSVFLLSAGIFSSSYSKIEAAPINNAPINLKQPNGEIIKCHTTGDEFYNYLHDNNGRVIVKNSKTGYYVYGKYSTDKVIPSRERVTNKTIQTLKTVKNDSSVKVKELKLPIEKIKKGKAMLGVDKPVQSTKNKGTLNNIVIFIKFSDQQDITNSFSTYNKLFNAKDSDQASLHNYYKKVSYNQLNINTSFYPNPKGNKIISFTDNHPRSYYTNVPQNQRAIREQTLLKNAVDNVKNQIPKNLNIDLDNDGKIDNVCFVVKGNAEGWSSLLWPHKWTMFAKNATINGKKVDTYNFQLEGFLGHNSVGVLSHEMFHTLGAPDLYHYNYDGKTAVGPWDVMDQTADIPQSMGAYMKMRYGKWIDKINEIKKPGKYSIKSINNSKNNSYIIKSPKSDSEYFVVEYRKKAGIYESSVPDTGILVYRINSKYNGNAGGHDEVYIYRPNGTLNTVGDINQAALSNINGRTSIGGKNCPLFFSNGKDSGLMLKNINVSNDTASFEVKFDENSTTVLPFKGDANINNNDSIINTKLIEGECVYGKEIKSVDLYVNNRKLQTAKLSPAPYLKSKYPGYNLDKSKFSFNVDTKTWSNATYLFEIKATAIDGKTFTIKKANIQVEHKTTVKTPFISKIYNIKDGQNLYGSVPLVGLALNESPIYAVDIIVDNVPISLAHLSSRNDLKKYYPQYKLSPIQFNYNLDTRRIRNGHHSITIRAISTDRKIHIIGTFNVTINN